MSIAEKIPDSRILRFIRQHHLLTLATVSNGIPWIASCFYAWLEPENAFVITTDHQTRHGREAISSPTVAGAIAWETKLVGKIQGIQFTGLIVPCDPTLQKVAERAYLKRFPVARLMETHLWLIRPDYIKMTHNQLGFGTKLIWDKKRK